MTKKTKAVALGGALTALALVFGYIEHLIPFNIGIYGVKLGLSNIVTVVTLYLLGRRSSLAVNLLRIMLSSLLFGNTMSLAYSLAGGVLSCALMIFIYTFDKGQRLSPVGVSICGGIAHNIGQLAVALVAVSNLKVACFLPVLLAVGALTGALIGVVSLAIIRNSAVKKLFGSEKNDCEG